MNFLFAVVYSLLLTLAVSRPATAATITLAATQDTWIVDADTFRDFNAGADSFVWVDGPANAPTGGLIGFDLASIGTGSSVASATLRLYHQDNQQFGQYLRAYRNLTAWNENTATASNAPAFDPTPVAELLVLDDVVGVYREWDVTSVVQSWVKGTFLNAGFRLGKEVTGGASPYFASREAALGVPELIVTYRAAVVPEPSTALTLAGALLVVLLGLRQRA